MDAMLAKQITELEPYTMPNCHRYRTILRVLWLLQREYTYEISGDELFSSLVSEISNYNQLEFVTDMKILIEKGNVKDRQEQDGLPLDGFIRRNRYYRLTTVGAYWEQCVVNLETETDGTRGSLDVKTFERLHESLNGLYRERSYERWNDVHQHFRQIQESTVHFFSIVDELDFKELYTLRQFPLEHLQTFMINLVQFAEKIREALIAFDESALREIQETIGLYEKESTIRLTETTPSTLFPNQWVEINKWFLGNEKKRASSEEVSRLTIQLIRRLMHALSQMLDHEYQSAERKQNLLALAHRAFASLDAEEAAGWYVATIGLDKTRHLVMEEWGESGEHIDIGNATAITVPIVHRNRTRRTDRKQPRPVRDDSEFKKRQRERMRQEREDEWKMLSEYGNTIEIEKLADISKEHPLSPLFRTHLQQWILGSKTATTRKYTVSILSKQPCAVYFVDGIFTLPNYLITFEEEDEWKTL